MTVAEKLLDGHRRQGRWILVPLADITMPKPGRICKGPHWWKVTENEDVLFFDDYCSPQCNTNQTIAARLTKGYDAPPTTARFIEMAYLPHRCSDYA